MSSELRKLRKELAVTKAALQAQSSRCRRIVATLTKKLQEKEKDLRASHELRDRQLACVLRSLLLLEARLRKEQKQIRQQLAERDRIIEYQKKENYKLRKCGNHDNDEAVKDNTMTVNTYKDNPVLESVQQILLKDEEDLLTVQRTESGEKTSIDAGMAWYDVDSNSTATTLHHERSKAWSLDHPNQLLPEATGHIPWNSPHLPQPDDKNTSGAWCIKVIEAVEDAPPGGGHERLWVKDKIPHSTKAQHFEEKACLQMSKKTLAIAFPKDIDEVEANSITVLESSYQEIAPASPKPPQKKLSSPQKPPALPPKPTKLLKPSEILQKSQPAQKTDKPRIHVQEIKRKQMNGHIPGNAKPQAQFVTCVCTNAETSSATNDNIQEQVRRHSLVHAGVLNVKPMKPHSLDKAVRCPEAKKETSETAIKMSSSVSSLITGATRASIVTELTHEDDSIQGKEGEDSLKENFEEFKLEESYVEAVCENGDDNRIEADGAETRAVICSDYAVLSAPPLPPNVPSQPTNKSYETFLETTGLSQKSILTPSRMLSNHRSCLKPKDVKHRSRVKAAAVGLLMPTVKYWTEPYL